MMPVLVWDRNNNGEVSSQVLTSRRTAFGGEEFRSEADKLDRKIDDTLGSAVDLVSHLAASRQDSKFACRWALGRALAESNITHSDELDTAEQKFLWLALARKCRLGIHANGEISDTWNSLIPHRDSDPKRIERDVFTLGLWLQEQEFLEAKVTLANSLTNAREMFRRKALSSLKMRRALFRWIFEVRGIDPSLTTSEFEDITKKLCKRWPGKGPGSAKQPVHYECEEDLYRDVVAVLDSGSYVLVDDSTELSEI